MPLRVEQCGPIVPATYGGLDLFEANGRVDGSRTARHNLRTVLDTMHGGLQFESQGKLGLSVIHPRTNAEFDTTVTQYGRLTDRDILELEEITPDDVDLPDQVKISYLNEETDFGEDIAQFPATLPDARQARQHRDAGRADDFRPVPRRGEGGIRVSERTPATGLESRHDAMGLPTRHRRRRDLRERGQALGRARGRE